MPRSLKIMGLSITACAMFVLSVQAEPSATQPVDTPEGAEVRRQMLEMDKTIPKMSLEDCRKTFHTESDREANYTDWLAHEVWEANKTEQAVRDKWGPDADEKFAHITMYTTREDDSVCHIVVDGNHATVTWDIKDEEPAKMIKVDGRWLMDVHAKFDDWLKENPTMETDRRSTGKLMKQARDDIAAEKFDDADSFIADFKNKWDSGN